MKHTVLLEKLKADPFRPFRVHLSDGTAVNIRQPGMVIVGISRAVLPTRFGKDRRGRRIAEEWRTVDLDQIVRLSDPAERSNGHRKR